MGRAVIAAGKSRYLELVPEIMEWVFWPPSAGPRSKHSRPREDDPQQKQMAQAAQAIGANKDEVHILDYAAGRGRLAVSPREAGLANSRKFTYFAYQAEPYTTAEEKRECLARIRELGQPLPPEDSLVNRLDRLCLPGKKRMDLVVMCNMLHELPVRKWLECFQREAAGSPPMASPGSTSPRPTPTPSSAH